jgi:TonB family protein
MSRFKTALSLYVALAVHLLLILLLAFGVSGRQSLKGAGSGFGGDDVVAPAVDADAAKDPVVAEEKEREKKAALHSDSLTLAATPIELQPKPKPSPKPLPAKVVAKKTPEAQPARAPVASTAVAGSGAAGGGSGGYIAQVRAQLSRNRRSLPGVLTTAHSEVAFNIGADGRVSDVKLVASSGISELDSEATAMVLRASPFPAPPDGKARRLSVPVSVEPPRL